MEVIVAVSGDHMSARADPGGTRGSASPARVYSRSGAEPAAEDTSPARGADEGPARCRELEPARVHEEREAGADGTTRRRTETDSKEHQSTSEAYEGRPLIQYKLVSDVSCLQCFDTVGWVAEGASGL